MTEDDKPKPFAPLGIDMPMSQRRLHPIPDDRRSAHALEHIAQVLDRIDAKLDLLIEKREQPKS